MMINEVIDVEALETVQWVVMCDIVRNEGVPENWD